MADRRAGWGSPPDFLWDLVASLNFMRLSEKKQVMNLLAEEALAIREINSRSLHYAALRSG
jgi:hypothetical protein